MEEATKLARDDGPWELLYADDLLLKEESEEKMIHMFNRWKEEMEQRGLKIYMEKTKLMVTGNMSRNKIHSGRWPCGCGRGVGANSILCRECDKWRCSGVRKLQGVQDFLCLWCVRKDGFGAGDHDGGSGRLVVDGGVLEEVQQFCYLEDILDCEGGVERAMRASGSCMGKMA